MSHSLTSIIHINLKIPNKQEWDGKRKTRRNINGEVRSLAMGFEKTQIGLIDLNPVLYSWLTAAPVQSSGWGSTHGRTLSPTSRCGRPPPDRSSQTPLRNLTFSQPGCGRDKTAVKVLYLMLLYENNGCLDQQVQLTSKQWQAQVT